MTYRDISLPDHAIRYLVAMLRAERHALVDAGTFNDGLSLQGLAHFDSLDALESAIPAEFWNE